MEHYHYPSHQTWGHGDFAVTESCVRMGKFCADTHLINSISVPPMYLDSLRLQINIAGCYTAHR